MGILDRFKGPIIQEVIRLIQNQEGGLSGLINKLRTSGLGDQVNSWIGMGENSPVSGNQMKSTFGGDFINKIAERFGISQDEAADDLADSLPQVVDKLTPNGKVDSDDILQQGLSALKGLFDK